MAGSIRVRNLVIGEGTPKICVPLTGRDLPTLLSQVAAARLKGADLLEWRADFFRVLRLEQIGEIVRALRDRGGSLPLLFTFRTQSEGGEWQPLVGEYQLLCEAAITGKADLVDIQPSMGESLFRKLAESAHAVDVSVVASYHDFEKTPPQREMTDRLVRMRSLGGDISKLAVMPHSPYNLLALLAATLEANRQLDCPLITMSMGRLGVASRLLGETFGSAVTFGAVEDATAPGQVEIGALRELLEFFGSGE
ncbi:MAG: type I 3-dehydroquinate dehydratase [Oscillospiraceae bacterium]